MKKDARKRFDQNVVRHSCARCRTTRLHSRQNRNQEAPVLGKSVRYGDTHCYSCADIHFLVLLLSFQTFLPLLPQNLAILAAEHRKVVAVVGAFHVPGIRARFPELALWATNTEGKAKNEKWISEAKRQASGFLIVPRLYCRHSAAVIHMSCFTIAY